ncbi:MAG: YIP1 family protein [Dehalococcoidales bacterium]|nr:MAG: YIP1 family protein [Dehalococcoidales bacterium]
MVNKEMMIQILIVRMVRAAKLDNNLYEEIKIDTKANGQAFLVVILGSLATGVGAGIAGIFQWAGEWSIWLLLIFLLSSIFVWIILSFLIYLAGTRLSNSRQTSVSVVTMLRIIAFSTSPLLLGFFLCIPIIGVYLWFVALIWALIAEVIAIKQVVGFSTTHTIINCFISWFACLLIGILISAMVSAIFVDGNYIMFGNFNSQVNSIVRPYRFSITAWEIRTIPHEISQWIRDSDKAVDNKTNLVYEYFSDPGERSRAMENTVELILENQVEKILNKQNIFSFPPVNIKLDTMPKLLVVSPRDRIESIREIMLDYDLSIADSEDIEINMDALNVSSLVVRLGGFGGAYPSFVVNDASLQYTVSTTVEEWVHQYLVFRPLGFRYVLDLLGLSRDYEIATINETVAGIISDEISTMILDQYYPEHKEPEKQPSDFDLEMREIRLKVDDYLAKGKIKVAEEFMEKMRQQLVLKGYLLRKLNQAYFAWHGTYADEPSSVSPIGIELRQLREQSDSIKEFLEVVSEITSRQDLKDKIELLD